MTSFTNNSDRLYEPLLNNDNSRFSQLPYKYPLIQKAYELAEISFWTAKEIPYADDLNDWESLTEDERYFIEHILAFFSQSDGVVLENLVTNFCSEVKIPEGRNFYTFQAMIENVHAQTYALLIDTFVKDPIRKHKLFNAIDTIPCVGKKMKWALRWFDTSNHFEQRVIAFAIVEGLFFSSSFASIYWLKSRGKMTKALGKSNELISKDESSHCDFAVLIYQHLNNKVSQQTVEEMIREAVQIEIEFITESIPCRMIGMNADLMIEYIKYVADRLLVQLGFNKIYLESNPFDFMQSFGLDNKTNFFENTVTEYVHASSAVADENSWDFS